ncbi:MAG: hypothetical protein IGS48_08805 [Oscillatoriales cyanobacterium C42_A2020_001]|nr:hypothetical protein [Leptolyngbyaceae cyanobacterium C42_A2020_001]
MPLNSKRTLLLFFVALMVAPMFAVLGVVLFQAGTAKQLPPDYQKQKRAEAEQLAQQAETQLKQTRLTATEVAQVRKLLPGETLLLDHAYRVKTTDFGTCLFVPVREIVQGQSRLALYLIRNGKNPFQLANRVLPPTWSFSRIRDVKFTELNFDGKEGDFILISEYIAPPSAQLFPVVTVYETQMQGFWSQESVNKALTERRVQTTAEAEKILREEFGFLP